LFYLNAAGCESDAFFGLNQKPPFFCW
jgi:hypothetical protein